MGRDAETFANNFNQRSENNSESMYGDARKRWPQFWKMSPRTARDVLLRQDHKKGKTI
jgi:hypothetical protein